MESTPLIVSYGAGINSTAMLVGMVERGIRPDAILFADTGGEHPDTYRMLKQVTKYLVAHEMPRITVVRRRPTLKAPYKTLEAECLDSSTLPSKAYGFSRCASKWKIQPQLKYGKTWQPAIDCWARGELVHKAVGFHTDEQRRIKPDVDKGYRKVYPLVEWGWTQDDCIAAVKRAGLQIRKSACFFCPSSTKPEVRALAAQNPQLAQRALTIERKAIEAGNLTTTKGLGRHWTWRDVIAADEAQCKLFPEGDDDLPCGCYDGEVD